MKKTVSATDLGLFQCLLQDMITTDWNKHFNFGSPPVITIEPAIKFARIVITQYGDQRSAYGFIEMSTGDLLKSASWKKPAKHARGSIFANNPLAGCGPHGMAYLT